MTLASGLPSTNASEISISVLKYDSLMLYMSDLSQMRTVKFTYGSLLKSVIVTSVIETRGQKDVRNQKRQQSTNRKWDIGHGNWDGRS